MGVKSNGQRAFILTIVVVFFLTSVAFTGFVIWDQVKTNRGNKKSADLQAQLQKQISDQSKTSTTNNGDNKVKLEGTKLAEFTPVEKIDSLQKIDTVVGTGDEVKPGDTVTAHYTGALAKDGTIFQSSHDSGNPVPFGLNQVIKGWTDGVPGMKVGGKRRLLIPAAQAYGSTPPAGSNIPADADLVFDIELVKLGE